MLHKKEHYKKEKKKRKRKSLTYFQSGQGVVNDADEHPPGFHRVDYSIQKETPLLFFGWFDQDVAPVEVPATSMRKGLKLLLHDDTTPEKKIIHHSFSTLAAVSPASATPRVNTITNASSM